MTIEIAPTSATVPVLVDERGRTPHGLWGVAATFFRRQPVGAIVEAIGVFVGLGGVGLLHEVVGLLEVVFLFLINELDLLGDGEEIFRLFVVAFVAMAAHAAPLTEQIFALGEGPADIIVHQHHIRGMTGLAARFHISPGE